MTTAGAESVRFQCDQLRAYFGDLLPQQEERCLDLLDHILKLQWNARGAADIAAINSDEPNDFQPRMNPDGSILTFAEHAIGRLDR